MLNVYLTVLICRDFYTVAENERHYAIRTSNPHPINDRQPQRLVPFGEDKWPLPYIPYEPLDCFRLSELSLW